MWSTDTESQPDSTALFLVFLARTPCLKPCNREAAGVFLPFGLMYFRAQSQISGRLRKVRIAGGGGLFAHIHPWEVSVTPASGNILLLKKNVFVWATTFRVLRGDWRSQALASLYFTSRAFAQIVACGADSSSSISQMPNEPSLCIPFYLRVLDVPRVGTVASSTRVSVSTRMCHLAGGRVSRVHR